MRYPIYSQLNYQKVNAISSKLAWMTPPYTFGIARSTKAAALYLQDHEDTIKLPA